MESNPERASAGWPRVLVVEDEVIVATDIQQTLQDMGYDAYATASSSDEALAAAARHTPQLALVDIRISGTVDGIETAVTLRERYNTCIIFVTAHADDMTVERAKRASPSGYLIKPVTVPALRAALALSLDRRTSDIRARVRELALELLNGQFATALNSLPVATVLEDEYGKVQYVNQAFKSMFSVDDEQIGTSNHFLLDRVASLAMTPGHLSTLVHGLRRNQRESLDNIVPLLNGRTVQVSYTPLRGETGTLGHVWTYVDVSDREQERITFEKINQHQRNELFLDELTGLHNRRGFLRLAEAYLGAPHQALLFYLDVDGLKAVNDLFGHSTGDLALRDVAKVLRETFHTDDLMARIGGDEFVVLTASSASELAGISSRLGEALERVNRTHSNGYRLDFSVGAVEQQRGQTIGTMLERADMAMYAQKRARGARRASPLRVT